MEEMIVVFDGKNVLFSTPDKWPETYRSVVVNDNRY
jgi:hypothetical protein